MEWTDRANEIKKGERKSILTILEERGLVNAVTGSRTSFDDLLTLKRAGAYVGIDPSAASLHVGHILPLMVLFWMFVHGMKACTIVGAATVQIGDPTDRLTSRTPLKSSERKVNMMQIQMQLKKLWMNVEQYAERYGYHSTVTGRRDISNNNVWLNKLSVVEFLKLVGTGFRLGPMLGRDTVKNKLEKGDGMSFAEFSYPLLQAYDWFHLFSTRGTQIQVGGADQYGNIVAGIEAMKHIAKIHSEPEIRTQLGQPHNEPLGLTTPLLTTSSGEKFGKSAGNAIWLDKNMTSTFDLYGYFVRTADADVERYLKLLTFVPLEKIETTMEEHNKDPSQRVAQHLLAKEFVELVHGRGDAEQAVNEHAAVFGGQGMQRKPAAKLPWQTDSSLKVTLPRSAVIDQSFPRVLYAAGMVNTVSEGHRLVQAQGAYIAGKPGEDNKMGDDLTWTPVKTQERKVTEKYLLEGDWFALRQGKWKVKICQLVSDEEFEKRGLKLPSPPLSEVQKKKAINEARKEVTGKSKGEDDDFEAIPERQEGYEQQKTLRSEWRS